MNQVISQVRRIFSDQGKGDKDFSDQEARLLQAREYLRTATDALTKAAGLLSDEIKSSH